MRTPLIMSAAGLPLVVAMMSMPVQAAEFVVTDIGFNGLQRLTPDSLYPVLPVTVGDTVNDSSLAASIKALYATENFADIQSRVEGGKLRFDVIERPTIAEVTFEGNKLIPKEGLEQGLKNAGLSAGDVLKQSTLQGVANELQQQYISQGYYNSNIEVDQTVLDGNRVKLDVRFVEGKPAKVVDINIIGNKHFSDEEIKDVFAVKESSWTRLLSKSDRYAQEKLAASLESLKALYQNDGYVRFSVDNAVLNISEDKSSVFIEVSLSEGEQYQFGEVNFLGKPTFENSELKELVSFASNEKYSQAKLDETTASLKRRYGNEGYYLAQIRPVPRINDDTKMVDVDYYIDPARPIYVRRINFTGNIKTQDEVLRREMRQLEGTLSSNDKIQLSRTRLMRTGFFKNVTVDVKPVPNQPDQVDVNYVVEEQPSGSSTIAAGYSQSGGVTFQLDLTQNNFMGTGNRVKAALSRSETRDSYSLGYTDPYFTENGVSQGISGYYRKTKYDDDNVSNYVTDSYGATLNYSYPIDETKRLSAGLNVDNTKVRGGRYLGISNVQEILDEGGTKTPEVETDGVATFKNDYQTYNLLFGWDYSTLDRPVFPTKGMSHAIDATIGLGDANYQKLTYSGNIYYPIYKDVIARGYTKLGYGNDLPFYENFYAGGYGSVRGYESSTLGPKSQVYYDAVNDPDNQTFTAEEVGGNALATFGAELILPMPFKGDWADQVRPVLFAEGGQVFDTSDKEDRTFNDSDVPLLTQDNDFRYSAGAGITWYTPIGPISLSYAVPFGDKEGDETEKVQFQIGNTF
ncbi:MULTISPECIES: outer membrane protein assembly factor BamA [Psychrobacter]|uniref:outer membrane protein assembly factor BamA n=1 Tax=Psychrobacter TaxID=497 RepID=UPI00086D8577|nr:MULTISPECIES: outer membrane protein assembly factor BamA [Psychrobacter]MBA6243894.1 outer membrane protein assembly factor BamA [Psychrobacter sp. Urea-trap-18]MBA6285477.1 outer membrane protein assembly factor BamA [Psychrobacter sp. Urea-trap-16]MBA6319003.1 outer membrane protein assembly factor BamA [Psychrobacter sp. Urea-trap-20]MBA6335022.1 outer membrane protein assembly factor BamA [Psychrobacter sp. Urea-trap-19]NYR09441.1 outer membrane protein assembly factor BamA [Psychrobac|tara:strand:+ start:36288 stop:38687 length:2400 start_codon:yes stop_codon:yes gene_type:complete